MSEQPKRFEHWGVDLPDGSQDIFLDLAEAQAAVDDALSDDDEDVRGITHYVELRDGESIVGPAEREVIDSAIRIVDEWDSLPINASRMNACRQSLEAAVRALREARTPKEPGNG